MNRAGKTYRLLVGIITVLFILLVPGKSFSQSFPVTINVQVLGQDLPYLEQFLSTNPLALQTIINLNDPTRGSYDVYLKVELSGAGVSLRSRANYTGNIFTLNFGQPLMLNGNDLRDHFLPQNMDFNGIDRVDFLQDGRLPEGIYNLCIEAYDINRPEPISVSNRGCGIGMVQLHDVPIIVAPISPLAATNPQNIVFQWIPQHVGSFSVEYDLVLFEVIEGYSEDQIIQSGEVSYVEGINIPQYVYSVTDPILFPGIDYLAYLRVRDPTGMRVFKNGGVSPVFRFSILPDCVFGEWCDDGDPCTINDRYGVDCACAGEKGLDLNGNGIPDICEESFDWSGGIGLNAPVALPAEKLEGTEFLASWEAVENADYYLLEVSDDIDFSTIHPVYAGIEIQGTKTEISGLPLDDYQYYRVRAVGKDTISFYSNAIAVTDKEGCIPSTQEGLNCDAPLEELGNMSTVLIDNLGEGDQIFAADYAVTINRLSGNGRYTGSGYIPLPYADKGRLNVRFKNIAVNENCQLINGYFEVTGIGLEILDESIGEFFDVLVDKLDELDYEIETTDRIIREVSVLLNDTEGINDYFSGGIDVAQGGRGLQDEYPYLPDSVVQKFDEAVDCITRAIEAGGSLEMCREQWKESLDEILTAIEAQFESRDQVVCHQGNDASYAYDSLDYARPSLEKIYPEIKVAGKPYPVHWKMVESGKTDYVSADLGSYESGKITFEYNDGSSVAPMDPGGNKVILPITGALDSRQQLYAVETSGGKYAGKLNILSYQKKKVPLRIVPINGVNSYPYDFTSLENRLEAIFGPALVDVDVELMPARNLDWFDGTLSGSPSNLLENYNDEMDRINGSISAEEGYYYLFLVSAHEDTALKGYWPRGRQFGYMINNAHQNQEDYELTVAHELAHGALRLAHIYEEANVPKGSTDNLMDYGGGYRLYGYQWDLIHNPVYEIAELDADAEGQSVVGLRVDDLNSNLWIDYDYGNESEISLLTPAGQRIILPTEIAQRKVRYGIKTREGGNYRPGVLSRFQTYNPEIEEWETYSAWYVNSEPAVFYGYAQREWDEKDQKYVPSLPWYAGLSRSDSDVWISGVEKEDCSIEVVTNSGAINGFSDHREATIIPKEISLAGFDQSLETIQLSEEECAGLDKIFVFNYSAQNLDTALLNDLYGGYNLIEDREAGQRHNTKIRLFFTDETTAEADLEKLRLLKTSFSEEVLWIHMEDGKYVFRSKYGPIDNLARYYDAQEIDMEEFMAFVQGFPNELVIAVYEIADFAANGVRTLRIPAYVWDCGSGDYDPRYAKIYGYVTLPLTAHMDLLESSIQTVWEVDLPDSETELAFICGLWNGLIEIVASVPELVKIVGLFDTELRNQFLDQIQALRDYKRYDAENQDTVRGVTRAFMDLFNAEFDRNNSCKFAHSISEYGLSIVIGFVSPGSTGSRAVGTANRFLVLIKAMDDLAGHLLSMGLKVRYIARGVEIISAVGNDVMMTVKDGVFRANVIINGRIDEIIADFGRMDLSDALVQTEDGRILRYNDQEYPLVSRSNKDFIASNIGIPVDLLDGFRAMGLRDVEIRDLITAYRESAFSPQQIYDYADGNLTSAKDVFLRDLTRSMDFGEWVMGDGGRVRSWEDFDGAGKKFSKTKVQVLDGYMKLSENNQKVVLNFSDNGSNSTLTKFFIETDDDILIALNKYEDVTAAMVGHKLGYSSADYENIAEVLDDVEDINGSTRKFMEDWIDRSTGFNNFTGAARLGNQLNNNIIQSIQDGSIIKELLETKLGIGLDEYNVFTEVPFKVPITSNTPGGFMKADIVLVRYDDFGEIDDVIIIENKLRGSTSFTAAQTIKFNEVKRASPNTTIEFTVKFDQFDDRGNLVFESETPLDILKERVLRISDSGTNNVNRIMSEDIKLISELNF